MNKLKQSGFGLVPILLIILIVMVAGLSGYYVFKQETKSEPSKTTAQQETTQEKQTDKPQSSTTENLKETLPTGWKKTSSTPLGFEFPYPEEWGNPEIKESTLPHTGKAYEIAFSKKSIYGMMISADYQYTGGGRGVPSWYISQPFDKEYSALLQPSTYSEVLKKNAYSVISISFNCVEGGVPQKLTSKLPQGGFDVLSLESNDLSKSPDCKTEPTIKPSIYADSKTTDQFETLAKLLNE